jgi:hypothetical protein
MSNSRVITKSPPPNSAFRSLAAAKRNVPQYLAGAARYIWEMTRGEPAVEYASPACINPQGLIGADLSGPPFGSAFRHSIATYTANNNMANVDEPTPSNALIVANRPLIFTWVFQNRKHTQGGPYSELYVYFSWIRLSGAATPSVTIKTRNGRRERSSSTSGPTGTETFVTALALYVPCDSGQNKAEIEFSHTDATTTIQITGLWLTNTAKR